MCKKMGKIIFLLMWKENIDIIALGKVMKIPSLGIMDRRRLESPEAKFERKIVRRYRRKIK